MKSKKSSGKAKSGSGKRGVKDLPARAGNAAQAKGGFGRIGQKLSSAASTVMSSIGMQSG
jgi:hypothetical protein